MLVCSMLFSLLPTICIAAEERNTFFSADFEEEIVGAAPKGSGFSSVVATDVACFHVVDDNGNNALKAWHGDPTNPEEKRAVRVWI